MTSSEVGCRTEAALLSALVTAGYHVSIPFGDGHRYDMVIDGPPGLQRVQCKAGRVIKDTVRFHCQDRTTARGSDYRGKADVFAVWCPQRSTAYLIPVELMPIGVAHLRLAPTRNGQAKGVHWAADYEIGRPGPATPPPAVPGR